MKVLFVYNFVYPDYQADCIYHGLIDSGLEVYETANPHYMLTSLYEYVHPQYSELCEYLFEYTKKNLTTKKLIERFL